MTSKRINYKGYIVTVHLMNGLYECVMVSPSVATNDYASEYEMYVHKAYKELIITVTHLRELRSWL